MPYIKLWVRCRMCNQRVELNTFKSVLFILTGYVKHKCNRSHPHEHIFEVTESKTHDQ